MHLVTANLTAVKVFSLFAKAPGFPHNQFLRKPKPGAIPIKESRFQIKVKSFQTSFGRSEGTVYSSSHMARRYPSNLKFLFKLHSRSTQRVIYLGMVIDLLTMTFSLLEEKVSAIVQKATLLKNKNQVLVREIYQFIGMCSATGLAVKEAPIYYQQLQHQVTTLLKENLLSRNQCYSVKVILLPLALQDLDWWIHNLSTSVSNPIILPPPDISIQTDASDLGWGGYLKPLRTLGMWTRSQLFWHMNRKELMAIFLSLKFFLKSQENVHVQIMTENSTSVSYLKCMGGTKSVTLSNLALDIWRWCLRKAIHISAVHVAGLLNIFADPLYCFQLLSTEWMLCKRIF